MRLISKWTSCRTFQRVIVLIIPNDSLDYSLNCTPLGPITITYPTHWAFARIGTLVIAQPLPTWDEGEGSKTNDSKSLINNLYISGTFLLSVSVLFLSTFLANSYSLFSASILIRLLIGIVMVTREGYALNLRLKKSWGSYIRLSRRTVS